ncbi:hypothetical protein EVAR_79746_1 [Eumeta japonica]|uniref:Zinc finger BED domain-containing protein 4 n=1 Tax=Eumeta variegata TaxID=151549 RepID=A0A4C1TBW7_EUMVA|nr:hypothetical protein EVAR_79746_1 [Eumeta japonica]
MRQTFKNSPTKNDMLQIYIQQEFGKTIQLVLDCKTRWSSLCNMISTYNSVKQCVAKTLVDLSLSSNPEYFFTDEEHAVLIDLENTLQPVKLAVEDLSLRAIAAQNYTSLQEELEETLRASKTESPFKPVSTSLDRLESVIKKKWICLSVEEQRLSEHYYFFKSKRDPENSGSRGIDVSNRGIPNLRSRVGIAFPRHSVWFYTKMTTFGYMGAYGCIELLSTRDARD